MVKLSRHENLVTQNAHPSVKHTYLLNRIDGTKEVLVCISRQSFRKAQDIQYAAPVELGHLQVCATNGIDSFLTARFVEGRIHSGRAEFANEKRQQRKPMRPKI